MRGARDEPWQDISRLRSKLRRLLDGMLPDAEVTPTTHEWTPRADIYASPEGLRIEIEACGIPRERLDVGLEGNVLTVRGVRERPELQGVEGYLQVEAPAGTFERAFSLGFAPSGVDADLARGVLVLTARR